MVVLHWMTTKPVTCRFFGFMASRAEFWYREDDSMPLLLSVPVSLRRHE